MDYVVLGAVTFLHVAVRAFQQINVTRDHIFLVPPTSAAYAWCEMYSTGIVATLFINAGDRTLMWVALTIGGSTGCICSMLLHRKLRRRSNVGR